MQGPSPRERAIKNVKLSVIPGRGLSPRARKPCTRAGENCGWAGVHRFRAGPLGHPGMTFMTGAFAGMTYNRFGSGRREGGSMAAIIFANCAVLDGTRKERREDHHVLVEGKRIREVSDRPINSPAAETIDLRGHTLMPGLID